MSDNIDELLEEIRTLADAIFAEPLKYAGLYRALATEAEQLRKERDFALAKLDESNAACKSYHTALGQRDARILELEAMLEVRGYDVSR